MGSLGPPSLELPLTAMWSLLLSLQWRFEMGSQVSMEVRGVHVVIVGGGFGGITAASQLQALNISFTLVDMKDSFHHNVAALRASVESGKELLSGAFLVLSHCGPGGSFLDLGHGTYIQPLDKFWSI